MLGSAMGIKVFWAVLLVPVGVYFIYSARREETVMLQLLQEQYGAYMARTGMLVPHGSTMMAAEIILKNNST